MFVPEDRLFRIQAALNGPRDRAGASRQSVNGARGMRRAIYLSRGDPLVFVQRPLSLSFLLIACLLLLFIVLPNVRKAREVAFSE